MRFDVRKDVDHMCRPIKMFSCIWQLVVTTILSLTIHRHLLVVILYSICWCVHWCVHGARRLFAQVMIDTVKLVLLGATKDRNRNSGHGNPNCQGHGCPKRSANSPKREATYP